jgi:hypothetical protein
MDLGRWAVLVTGITVLALGVMAGYDIFAAAPALLVVASGLFLVTVFYVMSLGDDRGHRPPLVMFVAGMAIVRRMLTSIRLDIPSARSHRTFASGVGGHFAQLVTGLRMVIGHITAASPRLLVARNATA